MPNPYFQLNHSLTCISANSIANIWFQDSHICNNKKIKVTEVYLFVHHQRYWLRKQLHSLGKTCRSDIIQDYDNETRISSLAYDSNWLYVARWDLHWEAQAGYILKWMHLLQLRGTHLAQRWAILITCEIRIWCFLFTKISTQINSWCLQHLSAGRGTVFWVDAPSHEQCAYKRRVFVGNELHWSPIQILNIFFIIHGSNITCKWNMKPFPHFSEYKIAIIQENKSHCNKTRLH